MSDSVQNLIAYAILAATEAAICASAAWVMVNDKKGWGWLITVAILILLVTRIKSEASA